MPRERRIWLPGQLTHTISRFLDREYRLTCQEDRRALMRAIDWAYRRWDWEALCFAFMSSHLHYGHIAGWRNPDRFFRSVHTRYAMRYHRESPSATLGPVFADRPRQYVIKPAQAGKLIAYQHRNPVDAGIVKRASESFWTSHRIFLRQDPEPSWLDVERTLALIGFDDTENGRRQFDEFVMDFDFACWTPEFVEKDFVFTGAEHIDWARLIREGLATTGLSPDRLHARTQRAVLTRRLIALFATRELGQTYAATAEALGMTTGAVFNLVRRGAVSPQLVAKLGVRWGSHSLLARTG